MLPGRVFSFLFFYCSIVRLISTLSAQKKSEPCKGKSVSSDLGILYPAPEIKNPNLNFKLRWREILPLAPRNYFLLAPTRIFLGIGDSRILFWVIPLCFSPLGFTMLLLSWGTTWMVKWWNGETNIFTLGFYYASPFLENYINFTWIGSNPIYIH